MLITDQSPLTKTLMMLAALVIVIAGMKMAESILVPFLLSVFLALILSPMLSYIRRFGVPNGLAIGLVILILVAAGFVLGALLGASANDFRENLPDYQQRLNAMFANTLTWFTDKGLMLDQAMVMENFKPGTLMQFAGNTLASLGTMMTNGFMILLTVTFILAEEINFADKLAFARPGSQEAIKTLNNFAKSVNSYLGIKTLMSFLTGLLILIWLLVLDVDYPVMWAILAFMLNYVPTIGSIIAAIPAVLLALIQLDFLASILTASGYLVVNMVVGNFLEPRWMGKGLNLSPLVVFLSLVFWGWVLGPVGMLLSVPLTIMVKIALENDPQSRWLGIILGGRAKDLETEAEPEVEKETAAETEPEPSISTKTEGNGN